VKILQKVLGGYFLTHTVHTYKLGALHSLLEGGNNLVHKITM